MLYQKINPKYDGTALAIIGLSTIQSFLKEAKTFTGYKIS
jgi:hypothetical protein